MRIPPLSIKIMLQSNPLKSAMLVRRLAVQRGRPSAGPFPRNAVFRSAPPRFTHRCTLRLSCVLLPKFKGVPHVHLYACTSAAALVSSFTSTQPSLWRTIRVRTFAMRAGVTSTKESIAPLPVPKPRIRNSDHVRGKQAMTRHMSRDGTRDKKRFNASNATSLHVFARLS